MGLEWALPLGSEADVSDATLGQKQCVATDDGAWPAKEGNTCLGPSAPHWRSGRGPNHCHSCSHKAHCSDYSHLSRGVRTERQMGTRLRVLKLSVPPTKGGIPKGGPRGDGVPARRLASSPQSTWASPLHGSKLGDAVSSML